MAGNGYPLNESRQPGASGRGARAAPILDFGISARQIRQAGAVGGVLGGLLFALFLSVGLAHGTVKSVGDVPPVLGLCLLIAALLPGFVAMAAVFGIRVADGQVESVFLGKWVVARRPLLSLTAISLGGALFPVVLSFADGSRLRLLGIHVRSLPTLVAQLKQLVPTCDVRG
jgi:hypothetical protein